MKHKIFLLMLVAFLLPYVVWAQSTITGKVVDANDQPIPGASVVLKNSKMGTVTGMDGKFSIIANTNDVLLISFIGFTVTEVVVNSNSLGVIKIGGISSSKKTTQVLQELTEDMYENLNISKGVQKDLFSTIAKSSILNFSSDPSILANKNAKNGIDITALDSDGDGLSDQDEKILGTDIYNSDTDGDALLDSWEIGKVNGIDLKLLGASPLHKDVFVQMDFMVRSSAANGLGPNDNVVRGLETAFANAPVNNPDGKRGINLHLILGNQVEYVDDLDPAPEKFSELKTKYFDPKRAAIFHYMIWANAYGKSTSSGNSFTTPNSDFIVTLGRWNNGAGGTDNQKIGTFLHELGHNLGLRHGGVDDMNLKPNHFSIMNYNYQMSGIKQGNKLIYSYQPFALPQLDESALLETAGLGKSTQLVGYSMLYFNSSRRSVEAKMDGVIDWNADLNINNSPVVADLNADFQYTILPQTYNEWGMIQFNGGAIGYFSPFAGVFEEVKKNYNKILTVELTEEIFKTLETIDK